MSGDDNALWARRIALRNAKRAAELDEKGAPALDDHLEKAREFARKHGVPVVDETSLQSDPERAARALAGFGSLPPIADPKGTGAHERAALEDALTQTEARIRACCDEHAQLDELLSLYRRLSMRLGALVTDTPSRNALDRSRVASSNRAMRRQQAEPSWCAPALKVAVQIRRENPAAAAAKIVKAIVAALDGTEQLPGDKEIEARVSRWTREDKLPPRKKIT